nr:HD domain-containing protein [Candidatus Bathyarchaeota archaeon]
MFKMEHGGIWETMGGSCAVIVVLDGCNVKAFKKADTPVLDEVMTEGAWTFKCKSVVPTATYTAHCSIVTGRTPGEHGVVGNFYYDAEEGRVIDFDVDDVNLYVEASTIFEEVACGGCVGEPITKGAKLVVSKGEVQARDVWRQDEYATAKVLEMIEAHQPEVIAVNFPGVDVVGEKFGPLSSEEIRLLEKDDRLIGRIREVLEESYEDYLIVVTADHGMTEVRENIRVYEVLADFNPVVCASHRFAHIYLDGEVEEARKALREDGRFNLIVSREEADKISLLNKRSGDLMVAAQPGYELSEQRLRGSHGGVSREEMYVPLIISKPEYGDVVKGETSIMDVSRIVRRYLLERKCLMVARDLLGRTDPAHGWDHMKRVLTCSTRLALKYDADVEAVRLASILHDAGRGKDEARHAEIGVSVARSLLEGRIPEERLEKVIKAILSHHTDHPERLTSLEEKILWDADKVDALGLLGLARCLKEAGWKGETIQDAIGHLERDTENFARTMHFKETKRLAKVKVKWSIRFIKRLRRELEFKG